MPSMVSYPRRLQSGQITCYLNRTYHVLTTRFDCVVAQSSKTCERSRPENDSPKSRPPAAGSHAVRKSAPADPASRRLEVWNGCRALAAPHSIRPFDNSMTKYG